MLALFDHAGHEIDRIIYTSQSTDVSQGRSPDGAASLAFFALPSPGIPNPVTDQAVMGTVIPIDQASHEMSLGRASYQ